MVSAGGLTVLLDLLVVLDRLYRGSVTVQVVRTSVESACANWLRRSPTYHLEAAIKIPSIKGAEPVKSYERLESQNGCVRTASALPRQFAPRLQRQDFSCAVPRCASRPHRRVQRRSGVSIVIAFILSYLQCCQIPSYVCTLCCQNHRPTAFKAIHHRTTLASISLGSRRTQCPARRSRWWCAPACAVAALRHFR